MKEEKRLYTFVLMALLTLSAYLLADTVDAMIGRSLDAAPKAISPLERPLPVMEPKRELTDYSSILERGLFGDGRAPSDSGPVAQTTSHRLIGTVEGDTFAGAVLQDTSGEQMFYRVGQKLPDGFQIVKVYRDHITLKSPSGGTVDLEVKEDTRIVGTSRPPVRQSPIGGVRRITDDTFMVDQRTVVASTENLSQILTQARALPHMEDGKTAGFRISEIVPGSIYEQIGLQNGDVIRSINAVNVDDPAKFFQMYQGLKDEKQISIDVTRGGQPQTLTYEIR